MPDTPAAPAESSSSPGAPVWRLESSADTVAITGLYANLVPALVQQVEPPPANHEQGLVHWRQGELLGYLGVNSGPRGVWVQPYFHPAAEDPERLLAQALEEIPDRRTRPLTMCVRSYQSWMTAPLHDLGFEARADQAVMVKRLAVNLRQMQPALMPALEGTLPKPTAPFTQTRADGLSDTGRQP